MKENGGPAFACVTDSSGRNYAAEDRDASGLRYTVIHHSGMTLRDWFAGMALQGIWASAPNIETPNLGQVAFAAYEQADAMLAERSKP